MTDIQPLIDTARASSFPHPIGDDTRFWALADANGLTRLVDLDEERDQHRDLPKRKTGTTTVLDVPSFLAVWEKHADDASSIYADPTRNTVIAVLDDDESDPKGARWRQHRIEHALVKTPQWLAWEKRNNTLGTQHDFAEHVENRLPDFVTPTGADMLEIAQTFQAKTQVQFTSGRRLSTGETQLAYVEQVDAKAGGRGQLDIPSQFELGLVPFEGSNRYRVTARLRYRISPSGLSIGYVLDRPEDGLRAAFDDVARAISKGVDGREVITGRPAA